MSRNDHNSSRFLSIDLLGGTHERVVVLTILGELHQDGVSCKLFNEEGGRAMANEYCWHAFGGRCLCSILTREERVETGVFLNYIRGSMIIYVKYYVNERSNESSAPH